MCTKFPIRIVPKQRTESYNVPDAPEHKTMHPYAVALNMHIGQGTKCAIRACFRNDKCHANSEEQQKEEENTMRTQREYANQFYCRIILNWCVY